METSVGVGGEELPESQEVLWERVWGHVMQWLRGGVGRPRDAEGLVSEGVQSCHPDCCLLAKRLGSAVRRGGLEW